MPNLKLDQIEVQDRIRTQVEDGIDPFKENYTSKGELTDKGVSPKKLEEEFDASFEALKESMKHLGLLQPIVVAPLPNGKWKLVAGERRFRAAQSLGWNEIPTTESLNSNDEFAQKKGEVAENAFRRDFTLEEKTKGRIELMNIIYKETPKISDGDMAKQLGIHRVYVVRLKPVREAYNAGVDVFDKGEKNGVKNEFLSLNQIILNAKGKHEAKTADVRAIAKVKEETKAKTDMEDFAVAMGDKTQEEADAIKQRIVATARQRVNVLKSPQKDAPVTTVTPHADLPQNVQLHNTSFEKFCEEEFAPFNVLHLDFPYGIDTHKGNTLHQGDSDVKYDDSKETYFQLWKTLVAAKDKLLMPEFHIACWCHPKYRKETYEFFEAIGAKYWDYDFIWIKNKGIAPDTKNNRIPQNSYEICIQGYGGDRRLMNGVYGNSKEANPKKETHEAEKPKIVLEHFLYHWITEDTRVLDPTMGGGNAIAVASKLKAQLAVGVEQEQEFYNKAVGNISKSAMGEDL